MIVGQVDPFVADSAGRRVLPSFSLAERDRRFGRVRELMAEASLDCLLLPATDVGEAQANSRYLSQIGGVQGGAWVVFPVSGEVTAIVAAERELRMWKNQLRWPEDLRFGRHSEMVVQCLQELGLDHARIGIVGLVNQHMREEGVIPYETWRRISSSLPQASFIPANEVLERARVVKGPEEVAVVRRIVEADEAAIARMVEVARLGVEEGTVWLALCQVLTAYTADTPARLSLGSNGRPANDSNSMALPIRMEDGGVLSQEIDARLQGYRAQCNHSILVGSKNADAYRQAMNGAIEVFQGLVEWIRPGRTVGEFQAECSRLARARGGEVGGVVMHTCGLGQDRPRPLAARPGDQDWVITTGWTFTIKPHFHVEATGVGAQIGEPVTVDDKGARRLGQRDLSPIVSG